MLLGTMSFCSASAVMISSVASDLGMNPHHQIAAALEESGPRSRPL